MEKGIIHKIWPHITASVEEKQEEKKKKKRRLVVEMSILIAVYLLACLLSLVFNHQSTFPHHKVLLCPLSFQF